MREFPASPMQTAVYTASLDSISNATANTQVSINFGETVDMSLIRQAWKWVTQHHSLLRFSFKRPGGGALALREHEDCEIAWRSLDWSKIPGEEIGTKWQQLQHEDASETIDLTKPPLYRFHAIELPGGLYHFLWTFHSILLDEESVFIILRDWLRIYDLLRGGQQPPLSQGMLSYAAVIGAIEGADADTAKRHWKNAFRHFSNWCPLRPLYAARRASHLLTASYTELFDRETTAGLNRLAASADASLPTLLTAAWGLVLARTNIDSDAIFGVYRSCRSLVEPQAVETAGLFDSLLPIRIKIPEELTCHAWLRQLQKEEAASTPFLLTNPEEVWNHANLRNNVPRFDSILHYLPRSINDRISMEMPAWTRFDAQLQRASAVPVRITAYGGERLSISIEYNAHQIPSPLARQLFDRLLKVIQSFEENSNRPLSQISITLPHETENLFTVKNPRLEKPASPDLFVSLAEIARNAGDMAAVEKEETSLSFSLVDTHSRQLAVFLRQHTQRPDGNVVALAMNPSPEMVVSLLGILKAGDTCLPLDPSALPADLEKILSHYQVSAVVTDRKTVELLGKIPQPTFAIDHLWDEITSYSDDVSFSPQPSDPALFLLQPNGNRLLIAHGTLQTALENAIHTYQTKPGNRILCHSLQGSAAWIEECLVPLLTGSTLVIPGKNVKSTRTAFQEAVESGHITHLRITAAFWSQWVHYLNELGHPAPSSLHRVLIEAGHMSRPVIEGWKELIKNNADCVVFYSPSGLMGIGIATEGIPAPELSEEGLVCGQPQPYTRVVLSDRHHRLVPLLFPGILSLDTAEAQDQEPENTPATTFPTDSGSWKLTPTEERARWDENGQLILISEPHAQLPKEFTWTQLRLIEETLTSHPDLIDAIVGKFPSQEGNLCAWIVLRDSHAQFPTALESHLRDRLPKDWIPSLFSLVNRFNLDAFDQIDEASLPQPEPASISKPQLAPPATVTTSLSIPHSPLSPITTLRTGILDTALYFVHAGRGLLEDYRPVVQSLSGGYAVHCLVVPRGRINSPTTVEEIVRQLLPAFRLHVTGKFAVAGIGTGAVFAWELARQLDRKNEADVPFIFFEAPPTGRKEPSGWFHKILKVLRGDKPAPYSPQGRFAELMASYQPPVLQRKPYFFVSTKPDPEWRRRAPLAVWGQLRLTGTSLLDEPGEIAGALRDVLAPLSREKTSPKSTTPVPF